MSSIQKTNFDKCFVREFHHRNNINTKFVEYFGIVKPKNFEGESWTKWSIPLVNNPTKCQWTKKDLLRKFEQKPLAIKFTK